jgi:hypothetical protein
MAVIMLMMAIIIIIIIIIIMFTLFYDVVESKDIIVTNDWYMLLNKRLVT